MKNNTPKNLDELVNKLFLTLTIDGIPSKRGKHVSSYEDIDWDKIFETYKKMKQIKKVAQEHRNERYNTDWQSMQANLYKIWKLSK